MLHRDFAYKYILTMSGSLFMKFNNAFVVLDAGPPIISILYGWSGIYGLWLCDVLFSLVWLSKLIIFCML